MRNRFVFLFVLVAILFACSSDSISNDDLDLINLEVKLQAGTERPFKIKKVEGTYSFIPGDGESCSAIVLNAIGEGTMSHLGFSTMLEEWCSNGPTDLGTRSITIIAANGDELRGTHSTILFTSATSFEETLNFDGGTGRFENAKGVFIETVEIIEDIPGGPTGTFVMSGEGTITY
ncbi:hypothetical protein [Christiangramia sediminis]|uniref:Uncharacterized protein n=1 Tax=Christiangramia sediminis TaxID=2881336 RepID=A0A9X1LKP9_9FLAO|nr:hypothetical protein [Christiangramia sediminis]MCB7482128.1 hypothetical protein [Christiangramia sediminis]